jgi:MFS family permease
LSPPAEPAPERARGPLSVSNFRYQWCADLFTSCSFEMETIILGWYVLVETGSVLMLTVLGALQFIGTLVAPILGVVGDRIGHRNLLSGMRAIYATVAALLTVLAFTGGLNPLLVLVLAGVTGLVRSSDLGMRAALVAEIVPHEQLASAASISRTTSDSARVGGALAGAGLFAVLGFGPAYLAVTAFYALGMLLTLAVRVQRVPDAADEHEGGPLLPSSPWRELREGVLYIWRTPHLLALMWIACLVNATAFPMTVGLLPYVARDIYGSDQTGLGYLSASFAFGALVGSVALSFLSGRVRPARTMLVFGVLWYAALLVFSHVRSEVPGIVALAITGFVQSLAMVPLTIVLLRTVDRRFRGRVMGVRMLAIYSLPLGLLIFGALIEVFGFAATGTLFSGIGLAVLLAIGLRWRADLWNPQTACNAR